MIKKLVSLALALLMVLSLAACAPTAAPEATEAPAESTPEPETTEVPAESKAEPETTEAPADFTAESEATETPQYAQVLDAYVSVGERCIIISVRNDAESEADYVDDSILTDALNAVIATLTISCFSESSTTV